MPEAAPRTTDGGLYPIGTVATLTGVPPITLRAWERRYGLVRPVRKPSGHRLYTRRDIDLIHRVVALLDGGMRIGQVRDELRRQGGDVSTHESTWWDAYRDGMVAAVVRFDEARLEELYGDALSLHPVQVVTRELLEPLLVELGDRWQSGAGSVAEEHFFSFYLRNKLGARFHHRRRDGSRRRILAACLSGEDHEFGLLLFALAAHEAGLQLVVLGANAPLDGLATAAARAGCEAIVLSASIAPRESLIGDGLARLVGESACPVFVGGGASVECFDGIVAAGAVPLGADIGQGIKRLSEALSANDEFGGTP